MSEKPSYPSQSQDKFVLRLPDGMRDKIAEVAKAAGRTMNAEIVQRLRNSLDSPTVELTEELRTYLEDSARRANWSVSQEISYRLASTMTETGNPADFLATSRQMVQSLDQQKELNRGLEAATANKQGLISQLGDVISYMTSFTRQQSIMVRWMQIEEAEGAGRKLTAKELRDKLKIVKKYGNPPVFPDIQLPRSEFDNDLDGLSLEELERIAAGMPPQSKSRKGGAG